MRDRPAHPPAHGARSAMAPEGQRVLQRCAARRPRRPAALTYSAKVLAVWSVKQWQVCALKWVDRQSDSARDRAVCSSASLSGRLPPSDQPSVLQCKVLCPYTALYSSSLRPSRPDGCRQQGPPWQDGTMPSRLEGSAGKGRRRGVRLYEEWQSKTDLGENLCAYTARSRCSDIV